MVEGFGLPPFLFLEVDFMRKIWVRFFCFVFCLCFLISNRNYIVYASGSVNNYFVERCSSVSSTSYYYSSGHIVSGNNIYIYRDTVSTSANVDLYFLSDAPFTFTVDGLSTTDKDKFDAYNGFGTTVKKSSLASESGVYYAFASLVALPDSGVFKDIDFATDLPVVYYDSSSGKPWLKSDFVLGSGGIETTNSIVYDSSIPAPENLTFKSESVGGFLGVGSKWEHTLSWSNGLASPPLFARVYSVAEVVFADTGQFFEDSTIPLVRAEDGYKAETGRYSVGTDYLSSKIMDGTVLNKVLEYRIQFCRYDADGNLAVGPVSTVHIKQNIFGKYDGYTVTTEYPKDDTDLGQSGGMDDNYTDKWTSDGNHYDDYDKDGNLVGSGTSEDGNFIKNLIDSLLNIPTLINSLFKSLQDMMSGIGELPVLLGKLFSFLPGELIGFVGLAFLVVIVLRIFGR